MTFFRLITPLLLAIAALPASATVLSFDIKTSYLGGAFGPVDIDVTVSADFSNDIGLTAIAPVNVRTLSSAAFPGVGFDAYFQYESAFDSLGLIGVSQADEFNRFIVWLEPLKSAPAIVYILENVSSLNDPLVPWDCYVSDPGLYALVCPRQPQSITVGPVEVTETPSSPVPLPASGLLALTGLGGLALVRRRRSLTQ